MDFPARYAQYSLLKRIAMGAYTDTYLARRYRDETAGREFVVKQVIPELATNEDFVQHVEHAAYLGCNLDHPTIASVFEFRRVSSSKCHLSMEYVWGEDLWRIAERGMTAGRFLPIPLACKVIVDIAGALNSFHSRTDSETTGPGAIWGDVSPRNVMVGYDGTIRLLDAGLPLRAFDGLAGLRRGPYEEKLSYVSPEQVEDRSLDIRSDIFSLGAVLYEFTTRKRLFKATNADQIKRLVANAEVVPPTTNQPAFPPQLEKIILRALERKPDDRFQTIEELKQELLEFLKTQYVIPENEELASYMKSIFQDKLAEIDGLLGGGYAGPDHKQVSAFPWAPFSFETERPKPLAEDHQVIPPPLPLETTFPELHPPSTDTPPRPPSGELPLAVSIDEGTVQTEPTVKTERPDERPQPEVKKVMHTLRRGHPDEFEKTAQRSQSIVWVLGVVMFAVFVGIGVYYAFFNEWPWEYLVGREVVDVGPREVPTPPVMPATINVPIESTPPGAAVAVNGVMAAGRTPATFAVVPNALNSIALFADGFETTVVNVEIAEQAPGEPIRAELVPFVQPPDWSPPPPDPQADVLGPQTWHPPSGRLNVNTSPQGASILDNGRFVCESPCEFDVPARQEQHISAQLPDHLDTVTFTLAPEWEHFMDTKHIQLELRELPSGERRYTYLEVDSIPHGAIATVNGERIGRTPLNVARSIEELQHVLLELEGYESWERVFYPSPGHIQISPILTRIPRGVAQLTLVIDAPDMPGTRIYLGPNEMGSDRLEAVPIEAGTYELTLSYTPPEDAPDPNRRRSRLELTLPPETHVMERYCWNGSAFERMERTETPVEVPPDNP